MVKRLLCYVKWTVDQGIIFPKTDGSRQQLTVFIFPERMQTWWGHRPMMEHL